MTSARTRRRKQARASLPRVIGANDNAPGIANDNVSAEPVWAREPGVKETPNQRIFRQMQRRALDEAPKPVRSYDPSRLTPDQEKRLRRATEQAKSPEPRKQQAAREIIAKIAGEVRDRVEAYRRANDNAETAVLEGRRGEHIAEPSRNEPTGRIRIASRDGLETLSTPRNERQTGRLIPPLLSTTQHAAGLRYRTDYEALDPEKGLTPPSIDQSRTISRGGDGYALKLKEISQRIELVDRMIFDLPLDLTKKIAMPALPDNHPDMRAAWIIRQVAGKGENLFNLSTSGSVRFRNSEALKRALDMAAIVYGLD